MINCNISNPFSNLLFLPGVTFYSETIISFHPIIRLGSFFLSLFAPFSSCHGAPLVCFRIFARFSFLTRPTRLFGQDVVIAWPWLACRQNFFLCWGCQGQGGKPPKWTDYDRAGPTTVLLLLFFPQELIHLFSFPVLGVKVFSWPFRQPSSPRWCYFMDPVVLLAKVNIITMLW